MKWNVLVLVLLVVGLLVVSGCGLGSPKCRTVMREVKGCDKSSDCECLHKSWGGLGACDSCECVICE